MKLPPETTVTITRSGSDGFVTTTVAALTGTVPRMSARFIPSEPPGGHPAPEEERWRGSLIVEFGWGAIAGYGFGEEVNPAGRLAADYAYWVHEVVEYKHEPPTKSGFLIDPVTAFAGEMGPFLAAKVKEYEAVAPVEDVELAGEDIEAA